MEKRLTGIVFSRSPLHPLVTRNFWSSFVTIQLIDDFRFTICDRQSLIGNRKSPCFFNSCDLMTYWIPACARKYMPSGLGIQPPHRAHVQKLLSSQNLRPARTLSFPLLHGK